MKGNYLVASMLVNSKKIDINQPAFSTLETPFLLSILKKHVQMIQLFFNERAQSVESSTSLSPLKIVNNCKNKLKKLQETQDFSCLQEANQELAKETPWDTLKLDKHTELFMDLMGEDYPIDESSVAFEY